MTGTTLGGGVAAAIVKPIKAELYQTQNRIKTWPKYCMQYHSQSMSSIRSLYKTPYTQEETLIRPVDYFMWISVSSTPAYIPMEQTYRLGPNTYAYPRVPLRKVKKTALSCSTMPQTVQTLGKLGNGQSGRWHLAHKIPSNINNTTL